MARAKIFDWIRPLSQEQDTQEFPLGHHTLRATMAMLRQLGVAAENVDYSLFMYRRREEPV